MHDKEIVSSNIMYYYVHPLGLKMQYVERSCDNVVVVISNFYVYGLCLHWSNIFLPAQDRFQVIH